VPSLDRSAAVRAEQFKGSDPLERNLRPSILMGQSAVAIATSFGIQMLNIVSGVVTARLLGPSGKGILTAVILWPGLLAGLGALGITDALVFFTAQRTASDKAMTTAAIGLALGQSIVIMVVGAVAIPLALGHYGAEAVRAGLVYLAWVPVSLLTLNGMSVLQGKLLLTTFNRLRLTAVAGMVAGLLCLYVLHRVSVPNIVAAYLAANVLALALTMKALWSRGCLGFEVDLPLVKNLFQYGIRSHTGNVAGITNDRADQAIISIFLPPVYLGWYAIAVTVNSALGLLSSSIGLVTLPAVASAKGLKTKLSYLGGFVQAAFALAVVIAVFLVLAAPWIIETFFGKAFLPALVPARILILAGVVLTVKWTVSCGLKALNRPLIAGIGELIGAVITVIGLVVLLPWLGIAGAAIASVLAYATSLAYINWISRRRLSYSPLAALLDYPEAASSLAKVLKQSRRK
jgi:O-antigen/teichoic acid export membrane protein